MLQLWLQFDRGDPPRRRSRRNERRRARVHTALFAGPPPRNALGHVTPRRGSARRGARGVLDLLQEIGVEFMGASARQPSARPGPSSTTTPVSCGSHARSSRMRSSSVPEQFTVTPRNPLRRLEVGGDQVAFGLVAGPPTVHDRSAGAAPGISTTTSPSSSSPSASTSSTSSATSRPRLRSYRSTHVTSTRTWRTSPTPTGRSTA